MNNDKAVDANQVKDQIEEDKKTSDANAKEPQVASEADFGEEDDGAKATDANQLDDGAKATDHVTDANQPDDGAKRSEVNTVHSKSVVDAKASESKDVVDKKNIEEKKTSAEADDQDWGNWQSSWQKKKYDQGLSHGAKKN